MSINLMKPGGHIVIGNRLTLDINSENYEELNQEIASIAVANNLKIETNYTLSTAIGDNITSLTIKGAHKDRKSFFLEIEKTYEIKTKMDLFE